MNAGSEAMLAGLRFGGGKRLPMILQTEGAECGLACLAMVASFYGYEIDLVGLRRKASISLKGATLLRLIEIAGQLSLETRSLRLELEELSALKAPCILHWDLNHFVVLKAVRARDLVIHDPARGVRQVSLSEVSRHFTGVALELWPSAKFKKEIARERVSLRALAGETQGVRRALLQIILLSLTLEAFALAGPFYMQWVMDQVLPAEDHQLLTIISVGFILLAVFQVVVTLGRSWCLTWVGSMLSVQWMGNLFGHLVHLPLDFFEKRHVGDVLSRMGSVQTIRSTLTTQFAGAILDGLMSMLALGMMLLYSLPLTGLVVGCFILYGLLRWVFFSPLRRATEDHIVYAARQQSELLESIRGIQALKLANQQVHRQGRYVNALVDTTNRLIVTQRLGIGFSAANGLIFGIERVALVWWAAALVLDGQFTAGMLVAFMAYADQFTQRASSLIDTWNQFRMLGLHAERAGDIVFTSREAHLESLHSGPIPEARIEVCNLSFRYADGEPWILENLTLSIAPGESVAIAAPSGAGKTTLAKLVLGLLAPTRGEVRFGGIEIRNLGLTRYRSLVAAVMQDDHLFAGSLADNISLFDPEATPLKIEAAAAAAQIHDEIAAMPMGYETLVGDMGSSLSGGQRQRVILARALYRRPKFLVLDEASSHLDLEKEREINALIRQMKITRLVLAHRPETLASADRMVVLSRHAYEARMTIDDMCGSGRNGPHARR